MLYYRLYKRMKRNFHFTSGVSPSLDYVTFVVLIPTGLGVLLAKLVQDYLWPGDGVSLAVLMLTIGSAALYIHLCEKGDKEP
jgi:hypothetical protein